MKTRADNRVNKRTWLYVSLAGFFLTLIVFIIFILFSARAAEYGITKSIYYIALIPAGLFAAAFLFGALRSYAKYTGENKFGKLELTGPVVLFCLVVIGGFVFAEPESTFSLTVRVSSQADNSIINKGELILDLGKQRLVRQIDGNGEVQFSDLPAQYVDSEVKLIPKVEGYKLPSLDPIDIPESKVIYLALEKIKDSTLVRGSVLDPSGNSASNAVLNFNSGLAACTTDSIGNFSVWLPLAAGNSVLLSASINGTVKYREYVTIPETQPIIIKLK